ncbi:serpin family protein [Tessaracoccus caeni]|uniref:serpin family protein n=1 Tax=Tessaracoccus caeni TaxID=3031239 RepID=UPI0023DB4DA1|nr:serpin family protein [Tessaracoccus caeni]MDF1486877.1 serpin family protein [Tessaracoccus caeni]
MNNPPCPNRRSLLTAGLLATLALAACSATPGQEVSGAGAVLDLPFSTTPNTAEAAAASQRLAWELIGNLDEPNRVVSPSSLAMSLVMAGEGAVGSSEQSIAEALGLSGDDRSRAFGALRQSLLDYDSLPKKVDAKKPPETPVVHQASRALVLDEEIKQDFLDRIKTYYDASATQAERAGAKADLDAWARTHTAGLIEKSGIDITGDTVLVLQDALLFAAAWADPFDGEITMPFHGTDGTKDVEGLADTFWIPVVSGENWSAIRLPYDDVLAADVILPKEGVAPESLTVEDLDAATRELARTPADHPETIVQLPSFDLTSKVDLLAGLPGIDLEHLDGIIDLGYAAQWIQQVRLQVTAEGTVGAALTEMAVEAGSAPMESPTEFIVDRPFVFRVIDTRTGWPLFLATIADPSAD